MIEREELVNDLANVLAGHEYQGWICSCGWNPPPTSPFKTAHRAHVAEQLAQCIERVAS